MTKPRFSVASSLAAMSLALLLGACATPPAELDLSTTRTSAQGRYLVALQPPATPPALNRIHSWTIQLKTPDGAPVQHARIDVDGGMPQHGHGLPTQPRVTQEIGDGRYLMEGMKFSMTGWWEIKLAIEGAQGSDKVTFNTVVKNPS